MGYVVMVRRCGVGGGWHAYGLAASAVVMMIVGGVGSRRDERWRYRTVGRRTFVNVVWR